MLLGLKELMIKYGITNIDNVIHIGAHYGEEVKDYSDIGVKYLTLIEPDPDSFEVLTKNIGMLNSKMQVALVNIALGDMEGNAILHRETANHGASNSILAPKKHLEYYPDIQFKSSVQVDVTTLDRLIPCELLGYTLINCDVQGFEKQVFKGATQFLKHTDAIYVEVNREELYEGCTQVEELDLILCDFDRVETTWTNAGWGDALYLRKTKVIRVPEKFRIKHPFEYPEGNVHEFERWFYDTLKPIELALSDRYYLPIFWTAYHVAHNFGKDMPALVELRDFINTLNRQIKYFTICQYDDGTLIDFKALGLDVEVFGMSGPNIDYVIPLIYNAPIINTETIVPKILCNFIGRNTHPIRNRVFDSLRGKANCYISEANHNKQTYFTTLARSIFTLCPRGYGQTSFRLMEALQYGSIPVYISDEHLIPHPNNGVLFFEDYALVIQEEDIPRLFTILMNLSKNLSKVSKMRENGKIAYQELYTYEATKQLILKNC